MLSPEVHDLRSKHSLLKGISWLIRTIDYDYGKKFSKLPHSVQSQLRFKLTTILPYQDRKIVGCKGGKVKWELRIFLNFLRLLVHGSKNVVISARRIYIRRNQEVFAGTEGMCEYSSYFGGCFWIQSL